jgi:hypothetical protein
MVFINETTKISSLSTRTVVNDVRRVLGGALILGIFIHT